MLSQINNAQVDDTRDIDVVMSMYKLLEYSKIYFKRSGSLSQYYRDEPALNNNDVIIGFLADNNNSILFKYKKKQQGKQEVMTEKMLK